jgi:GntR family transcriptional repressor for pyruvate dehydrogenase complex
VSTDPTFALPGHDFELVTKTSLSEEIAIQIMRLVSNGDLKPGQKLPSERDLRLRFGVGRSSLREALRCLAIVGVLEARAGEGTFLAMNQDKFIGRVLGWRVATERKNVENLLTVRLALEAETASHAALNTTEEQIQELDDIIERMVGIPGDPEQYAEADVAFHLTIAKASANDLIFDLLTLIRGQLQHALLSIGGWPRTTQMSDAEHRGIVEAIRRRDSELARRLMREHIEAGLKRYQEVHSADEANGEGKDCAESPAPAHVG